MDESVSTIKSLRKSLSSLRQDANGLYNKIICRKSRGMFLYPKNRLKEAWVLTDVYERTMAAQELGWNVVLRADADGLHVDYAEKLPSSRPMSF